MKKALLVAASLLTTAAAVTTGAEVHATQGPSKQFVLTQSTAGNLVFQGVGTAQYNNSIGTNNSFQVGSSTNLGVNASTSSTPEYEVTSHAKLDLSGDSVLKQIIGTSGASQTKTAEQVAAMTWADTTAKDTASTYAETTAVANATTSASSSASSVQSSWESSNGGSWESYHADAGWTSGTHMSEDEWYNASQDAYDTEYDSVYDSVYTTDKNSLYDSKYTEAYNTAYTEANSNISTDTNANSTNGVIKGTFTTSEFGEAEAGGSAAEWRESASATAEADTAVSFQNDWAAYETLYGSTGAYTTSDDYDTARTEAYSTAYADAYASSMSQSSRTSSSDVEVTGIGSDASVTAAGTSTFDVLIETDDMAVPESTATANGAAGANLSTSSFANQSQASTASAFMQAFGADTGT